ncbi:MAG: ATP-dependent helicase HrpB [Pseudomonadales bacterium]|jgi:ATP-dependent helicase HrpB|nr:ATP-dependent helicase HrpB [Pseudomonadales bacterium]
MDPAQLPGTADLPVLASLDALRATLAAGDAVLQAPPGAGKSTLVPLALLDARWAADRSILMLEPRRIAARSVAHRMAELLGERVGETVGYRMRLETRVSARTRIEVVTEGVLTRMLQTDPALAGYAAVIFDEFHERSLDGDLALALTLAGRELFRDDDPLRLLVMSATLDVEAVARLLGNAPVIRSEGRQYPVRVCYGAAASPRERIVERVVPAVLDALRTHPESSQLVFLPGEGEIRRTAEALEGRCGDAELRPLHGGLDLAAQRHAIAPAAERKIVLATNIAETSLTIEGVDVVIDAGFARQPAFDPRSGMTRLALRRIARDAAEQRAGRAGRLRPGVCYRLWSAQQHEQLAATTEPEIRGADLAGLALQLLAWGVADPAELTWLDAPPRGAWRQALDLLAALGALDRAGGAAALTKDGEAMAALGAHPRVARLLLAGARAGAPDTACRLAALLEERDPLGRDDADLATRLALLDGTTDCPRSARGWRARVLRGAEQYQTRLDRLAVMADGTGAATVGALVAYGWPDRVARKRRSGGYQLANGRSANLDGPQRLGRESWLAVADVGGAARRQGDVIGLAAALDPALFDGPLAQLVREKTVTEWERGGDRFVAERQRRIGALVLSRARIEPLPEGLREQALLDAVRARGLTLLDWKRPARELRDRIALLRRVEPDGDWPDLSDDALLESLDGWLAPWLTSVKRLGDLRRIDLVACLTALLEWPQQQALDRLAPRRLAVPSGSSIAVDYSVDPPVLAVKLQEMFGQTETPAVANGKVPLSIHLLSPAGRPLQVTQDLATFWRDVYPEVRKEMRGRYGKHPWPEDPLTAAPTRHTKKAQSDAG